MSRRWRWWVGLIATPLVVLAIQLALTPILFYLHLVRPWIGSYPTMIHYGIDARMILPLVGIAFIDILLPGLPTLLVLRWLHKTGVLAYAMAGLSAALLATILALELFAVGDSGHWFTAADLLKALATPGDVVEAIRMFFVAPLLYGMIAAIVFWLFARPDRSAVIS